MTDKLIILDRDGVINEDSDAYIKSPEEFIPIPGSLAAIAQLNKAGFTVVVATNQSGIARGYFDVATLNAMHDKLNKLLAIKGGRIDRIYYCPHGPDDNCACRKPEPGMLRQILVDYKARPSEAIAVGDSLRDLQATAALDIKSFLVRTGKGRQTESQLSSYQALSGTLIFDNLADAVTYLVSEIDKRK